MQFKIENSFTKNEGFLFLSSVYISQGARKFLKVQKISSGIQINWSDRILPFSENQDFNFFFLNILKIKRILACTFLNFLAYCAFLFKYSNNVAFLNVLKKILQLFTRVYQIYLVQKKEKIDWQIILYLTFI